ncbi:DUF4142 domain-containing protein [Dyadobacter sp. CY327]|uniref:DUF4142 domain-containing protein n=1 Tax=Dyadobacter sp. CY327 TaxID=2907301 RepID=UPI001F370E8A|nr:DUF4142 domain-containing protein [Dyadobacter sp. CY327]MCE7071193.1 DUF4142 domain-containing protein [Dyadobacter sp. CY327]
MKRTKFFFLAAALSFATVACDDDTTGTNAPAELDKQFMLAASDGGLFEINAGQVASSKGTTQTIKQFGQEMLDDHTSIKQELMKIAKDANVDLPTTLSSGKQQKLDSLSELSGIAFDTTYIKMVTISHEEAVNLYEIQDKSASNVQLKTFAADKLPRLKAHLEKAKAMRDSIQ